MIDSCEIDEHSKLILRMFNENAVLNLNGEKIEGVTLTTPQKHDMVKTIYSSKVLTADEKKQSMDMLAKIDQSDKLGLTQQFCISAVPEIENKRAVWARLFDSNNESKLSLYQTEELCLGFRQYSQRDMVVEFREDFFNKIDNVIKTQGKNTAESYWYYLQPNMFADDKTIGMYSDKLTAEKAKESPSDRLIKWLTDAVGDLKEK